MNILESIYQDNLKIEKQFKHRAVLAILCESFEAPVVTLLEGLQELDFKVYVIDKSNINSWFMDEVIDDPRKVRFDFILNAFHWGTRWDHFDKFGLHSHFKVLIDACDNRGAGTWMAKYEDYRKRFRRPMPPEEIANERLQPHRWTLPLGNYKPDLIFTSQKLFGDKKTHYFPFGIRRAYLQLYEGKSGKQREIDFAHIPGIGPKRRRTQAFIAKGRLPGHVFNKNIRGRKIIPQQIARLAEIKNLDCSRQVSSYDAWALWEDYFKLLNSTKALVWPGISEKTAWWDSKRPWEAYASGCLVLLEKPNVDISEYPITELCGRAMYGSLNELVEKCKCLVSDQRRFEYLRNETWERAQKYFTPVPLSRYFLSAIRKAM